MSITNRVERVVKTMGCDVVLNEWAGLEAVRVMGQDVSLMFIVPSWLPVELRDPRGVLGVSAR